MTLPKTIRHRLYKMDIVKYGPVNVETFTKFYSYIKEDGQNGL